MCRQLKVKGHRHHYITHRLAGFLKLPPMSRLCATASSPSAAVGNFDRDMLVQGLLPPNMETQAEKGINEKVEIDYTGLPPVFEPAKLLRLRFQQY